MPMGWWRPYFFWDLNSVQVLHEKLVLDGSLGSILLVSLGIAALAFVDRLLAHHHKRQDTAISHSLHYMLQKSTGGLLMLILMSFNIILFMEVILFCGMWEYVLFKYGSTTSNTATSHNNGDIQFAMIRNESNEDDGDHEEEERTTTW